MPLPPATDRPAPHLPSLSVDIAGESALLVTLAAAPSPALSALIQQLATALRARLGDRLLDLIPAYTTLLVLFDPERSGHRQVAQLIEQLWPGLDPPAALAQGREVALPVWYGAPLGPDLARLAARAGLSVEAVIARHQALEYRVFAIGFAPGFAYLGEVDARIACPRLATPRLRVPAGAVAIADRQTAVYPAASPGGWNLIGLCPTPMFAPQRTPPMLIQHGDRVRFYAIDRARFLALGGQLPTPADTPP